MLQIGPRSLFSRLIDRKYSIFQRKRIIEYGKNLSKKYPNLRPYLRYARKILFSKNAPEVPRFSGWGMTTMNELPWINEYDGEVFRKASRDIKKTFEFDKSIVGYDSSNIEQLLWRHWNISTAVKYAIKFTDTKEYHFVECGVAEGMTVFFALREIFENQKVGKNFSMHLYDSWNIMKEEELTEIERDACKRKNYQFLNINKTKKNLSEFDDYIIYHQGYIPKTFSINPEAPKSISYLHIDLNSVKATQSTLEFFFPRLEPGGVIILDDYGAIAFEDTRIMIDAFFHDKPGILLKSPTGQTMYCHH